MTVVDISLFYGENCMLSEITETKIDVTIIYGELSYTS